MGGLPALFSPLVRRQVQDAVAPVNIPAPVISPVDLGAPQLPALSAPKAPVVTPSQTLTDVNRLNALRNAGDGISQISNPLGRIAARTADIAGTVFSNLIPAARGIVTAIPGTSEHHNYLVRQAERAVGADQAIDAERAKTANTQTDTALGQEKLREEQNPEAAPPQYDYVDGPNGKVAILKGTTTAAPVTIDGKPLAAPAKPVTNDFELWHAQNPDGTAAQYQAIKDHPISPDEASKLNATYDRLLGKHGLPVGQFTPGMSRADTTALQSALGGVIGKQQGDVHISIQQAAQTAAAAGKAPLDTSDPAMAASVASVASGATKLQDVFGRGATTAQKAQFVAAVKAVNPNFNSGDHDIENKSRQYMITGQGGVTLTAGNTLTHHLDLYERAAEALKNGDSRALNSIGNELGVQTGKDSKTNMNLIARGVATEAARFYTGGVPGETEIEGFLHDLNANGSPDQMHGGAATVRGMARGKMDALKGQAEAGARGQANFETPSSQKVDGHYDPATKKVVYH